MDKALTGGIGAGTSIAIGLELLKTLREPQFAPSSLAELCLPPEPDSMFHLHWFSIFLGSCIGLILGPVLEAVVAVRVWLYQIVVRKK